MSDVVFRICGSFLYFQHTNGIFLFHFCIHISMCDLFVLNRKNQALLMLSSKKRHKISATLLQNYVDIKCLQHVTGITIIGYVHSQKI